MQYLHSAGIKGHDRHEDEKHAERVKSSSQAHLPAKPLRDRHRILNHDHAHDQIKRGIKLLKDLVDVY